MLEKMGSTDSGSEDMALEWKARINRIERTQGAERVNENENMKVGRKSSISEAPI